LKSGSRGDWGSSGGAPGFLSIGPFFLILAYAAALDDPELAFDVLRPQCRHECYHRVDQVIVTRLGRQAQDGDPRIVRRSEKQGIGEVEVECDQAALLRPSGFN